MRQFIYLDTDAVNSIVAQKEKGLVLETASEHENITGKDNTKTGNVSLGGSAEGGIWKFAQAQAELNATVGLESNRHSQTVLKEIATKTLHDAAFDIAYEQIKSVYNINSENAHQGSFVELDEFFEFVDLEYFEYLFSEDNNFLKFFKQYQREAFEASVAQKFPNSSNKEQQRKSEADRKKKLKEFIDKDNQEYEKMFNAVKAIRHIIPYKRMLISSNGYLMPLDDKYFRDNPQTVGFKHGSDVTCLGYITNVISERNTSSSESVFSYLHHLVNQFLISILPTRGRNLFVVHPIAIYYKA